ncbi:uncharacterized protein SPSK_04607 [Sporothrix schenckii 1099-18]|uniref:Uncharacterized protein n=1 Tax=Sporothrix schenckii 1099-18 TaxID=1397361 RepID=A0A0F2M4T6_SPOSC|nr:uncharacterized protein SPSK_04607 [Sporothrix schenckii 1099-18]KJR83196.1 hypothetical protein SPSK_04607 [Sporothrix schenckii 1099-18]
MAVNRQDEEGKGRFEERCRTAPSELRGTQDLEFDAIGKSSYLVVDYKPGEAGAGGVCESAFESQPLEETGNRSHADSSTGERRTKQCRGSEKEAGNRWTAAAKKQARVKSSTTGNGAREGGCGEYEKSYGNIQEDRGRGKSGTQKVQCGAERKCRLVAARWELELSRVSKGA